MKYLIILFLLSSCFLNKTKLTVKIYKKNKNENSIVFSPKISNIQVINHQIVITGTNLDSVEKFLIKEGNQSTSLLIESKSTTSIVANTIANVTFATGKIFDFILSNASASSNFTVNFSLCDSTLGGKGFNCSLTPNDKDVLSYDASSGKWQPRAVNGLAYQGLFDASSGAAPTSTAIGDYYIISVPGTIGAVNYSVGDWIVLSSVGDWERINNSNAITTVFGRTGAILGQEGDYNLDQLSDVNLSVAPTNNQVLKFNGTNWIAGNVNYTETDPNVTAFAKAALPTCNAGEVLKSNGTILSCVTDNSGAGSFTGTANRAVITDGAGALSSSSVTSTEVGYLSGATSSIQTQLNNKEASITAGTTAQYLRGDKSLSTFASDVIGSVLAGLSTATNAVITASDTILSGMGKLQKQVTDLDSTKLNLTGGTLSVGTIDGVPNPTTSNQVANKAYVDSIDLNEKLTTF